MLHIFATQDFKLAGGCVLVTLSGGMAALFHSCCILAVVKLQLKVDSSSFSTRLAAGFYHRQRSEDFLHSVQLTDGCINFNASFDLSLICYEQAAVSY